MTVSPFREASQPRDEQGKNSRQVRNKSRAKLPRAANHGSYPKEPLGASSIKMTGRSCVSPAKRLTRSVSGRLDLTTIKSLLRRGKVMGRILGSLASAYGSLAFIVLLGLGWLAGFLRF